MYEARGRVLFKVQLYSVPMNWDEMLDQLKKLEAEETLISLYWKSLVVFSVSCYAFKGTS